MPTFDDYFGFSTSPFEQYIAEKEPKIDEYAVKPPYFEETIRRIERCSSYLLFGSRGSGKSATRLTAEKGVWSSPREDKPLIVTLTDFSPIINKKNADQVTDFELTARVAFLVVEAVLLWISDQEEKEAFVEMLTDDERANFRSLANSFYFSLPEAERALSAVEAMRLLQQNWRNRTLDWADRKWNSISQVVAKIGAGLMNGKLNTPDVSAELSDLLGNEKGVGSARLLIIRLVDLIQLFGFTGVVVLVDKIDEHAKTQKSAEATAQLVHPIVSQVQLMEIDGFAWVFFLWDKVKEKFSTEKLYVRLDKFAHSEVSWSSEELEDMVRRRLVFFSDGRCNSFTELCEPDVDVERHFSDMLTLVQKSPRELIRLLDTVVREYNSKYGHSASGGKLSDEDLESGKDAYVRDVLWNIYDSKILSQILRFDRPEFTNKEVQKAFKIEAPSARGRIQSWEACGAVHLKGTRAPEGEMGGKPSNEYAIADPRILRMASRKLYDPDKLTEAPINDEI